MLLQLFEEAIIQPQPGIEPVALNPRFQIRGNYIEVRSDDVFERQPWALLEIFRLLQQHPKIEGIRAQTLRLILRDGKLLDDAVRQSVQARTLFIGMFREGYRKSTRLNSSH